MADAGETSSTLLGKIDFPNSGSAEAQPAFIEGVLYLHNFEYEQAAEAFRRAQEADPEFALAYWGETMTHHQSIWEKQEQDEGQVVLRRLNPTPEARAAMAPTPREKAYLGAVEVLFGTVEESKGKTRLEREILYREAMRRLHEAYPEDHEAASFYALSILGAGKTSRNFATYMRAAAIVMEVWDVNRLHPGAAHYLIHSFDDTAHAPLGLPMALAYSKIAPAAAHAQHMTSHIFLALGMWSDVVTANETAFEIEVKGTNEWSREASHYVHWLHYGYLQQGRYQQAEELLETALRRLNKDTPARERGYYGTLYTQHLVESDAWDSAARWAAPEGVDIPSSNYHFAWALEAINRGDLDAARERALLVQAGGAGNPGIIMKESVASVLRLELEAKFALVAGDHTTSTMIDRSTKTDPNLFHVVCREQLSSGLSDLLQYSVRAAGSVDVSAFESDKIATSSCSDAQLQFRSTNFNAKVHGHRSILRWSVLFLPWLEFHRTNPHYPSENSDPQKDLTAV